MFTRGFFKIGICNSGVGVYQIEQKVFPFYPGDMFCISHIEYHNAYCPNRQDSMWDILFIDFPKILAGIPFDPVLLATEQYSGPEFVNRVKEGDAEELHRLARALVTELDEKRPFFEDAIRAIAHRFLVELARERPRTAVEYAERPNRTYADLLALKPAIDLVVAQYRETVTIQQMAEACHLSETHFRRKFTALMERGPLDYVREYRIAVACAELKFTGKSIGQIGFDCGFGALSSFNRQFAARRGCTPGQWRTQAGALR